MSTDPQIQTIAAQNALSGEKTFRTVQFAITGNSDADAVAGICAVLAHPEWTTFSYRAKQRILEYLALRFKDEADCADRFAQYNQTSALQGLGAAQQAQQRYPSGINETFPPLWGTTSGGQYQQPGQSPMDNSKPDASTLGSWIKSLGLK